MRKSLTAMHKTSKFEETKDVAIALLSSDLPVDDILIDEVDIDDVIRQIFGDRK